MLVAVAGPNGAGKTTFYHAHLKPVGLRLVNADTIARELRLDAYEAANLASAIREQLIVQRESFVFETVFSDPAGDKLAFLKRAASAGYAVIFCFIGVSSAEISDERVAMRVSQGGHDVPVEKLRAPYPRILRNLKAAIRELPYVRIYDNDDLLLPYRLIAVVERGSPKELNRPIPNWLRPMLSVRGTDA